MRSAGASSALILGLGLHVLTRNPGSPVTSWVTGASCVRRRRLWVGAGRWEDQPGRERWHFRPQERGGAERGCDLIPRSLRKVPTVQGPGPSRLGNSPTFQVMHPNPTDGAPRGTLPHLAPCPCSWLFPGPSSRPSVNWQLSQRCPEFWQTNPLWRGLWASGLEPAHPTHWDQLGSGRSGETQVARP